VKFSWLKNETPTRAESFDDGALALDLLKHFPYPYDAALIALIIVADNTLAILYPRCL
jgi:hypothetical protein